MQLSCWPQPDWVYSAYFPSSSSAFAMASSSANTSIPLHELIFQQFLHDVHHAYLLLHRAMALLPPTMIPNMDLEALPSTGVWDQPEGLLPQFSAHTDAFVDNFFDTYGHEIPIASPTRAEDRDQHDDQVDFMLPEPHVHVSAPDPAEVPDTCRFSHLDKTPAKRPKPKTTPKAPAKRQRRREKTPPRSPSPTSTWTLDDKKKLRILKEDERSRYSWKVIASKLGRTAPDVKQMWESIKDDPEWTPSVVTPWPRFRLKNRDAPRSPHPFHYRILQLLLCDYCVKLDQNLSVTLYLVYTYPDFELNLHLQTSCPCAPILIDIALIVPWPSTLYLSHRVQDLRREDLPPRPLPLRFIVLLDGIPLSIDPTDPLSLCLTSSQCSNWRRPTHISTFSPRQ